MKDKHTKAARHEAWKDEEIVRLGDRLEEVKASLTGERDRHDIDGRALVEARRALADSQAGFEIASQTAEANRSEAGAWKALAERLYRALDGASETAYEADELELLAEGKKALRIVDPPPAAPMTEAVATEEGGHS